MRDAIEIVLWILLVLFAAGFIWLLFSVPPPWGRRRRDGGNPGHPGDDIGHIELYQLLCAEIRHGNGIILWAIAFQTGMLAILLGLILSRL